MRLIRVSVIERFINGDPTSNILLLEMPQEVSDDGVVDILTKIQDAVTYNSVDNFDGKDG